MGSIYDISSDDNPELSQNTCLSMIKEEGIDHAGA